MVKPKIRSAKFVVLLAALTFATSAFGFVITDIRVEGLQRISAGTVFGAIPYNVGDDIGTVEIRTIARSLFETESFDDVQIGRDGNVLVAWPDPPISSTS